MAFSEMTMAELDDEIDLLEQEMADLIVQRAQLKQRKFDIHNRIEEAQRWREHRRMIEDPPDPDLTQGIG